MSATAAALTGAARDAREAWRGRTTLAALGVLTLAAGPAVLSPNRVEAVAGGLYLATAAIALALCVGVAGLPLLCQGSFMAVGAFSAAHLLGHGVPWAVAAITGAVAAAFAGGVVGAAFVRLPRAAFAGATWIVSWLALFALSSFPSLGGGAEGLIVTGGPSLRGHYMLALALLVLTALGWTALVRGPFGLRLAAARDHEGAARVLGVPCDRLRITAVAAAGAVAGLAGALGIQLAAVADAGSYDTVLSFQLFVAVLLGGALTAFGPPLGVLVLALVSLAADGIGTLERASVTRAHPLLAAALLLALLSLGFSGALRPSAARRRRKQGTLPRAPAQDLSVHGVRKRYGELTALSALDLALAPGTITALIGPNGSGKTTALRVLAGAVSPDAGELRIGNALLLGDRVARGVARTLQSNAVFAGLTALDHVLIALVPRRRYARFWRTLLATPHARSEDAVAAEEARAVLARFGLADRTEARAGQLTVLERRILMLASAYATGASVLLVDEPTAGASRPESARVALLLRELADEGLALLVVEHNLDVVRAVADHVVALDAGAVVASGSVAEVAANPRVRASYLGGRAS